MSTTTSGTSIAIAQIESLHAYTTSLQPVLIDGQSLDCAAVIAVSRHDVRPRLTCSESVKTKVQRAAEVIQDALNHTGGSLYGVTTGVGASAFTRTRKVDQLQRALVNKNLNGILPTFSNFLTKPQLGLILPEDFMKGTILVRLNTLIRGHSGVRWTVVEKMFRLLEEDIVPCAPKNNTISASGDLGTLAYIAGTLLGLEDVHVWHGESPEREINRASEALRKINMEPVTFGPKEAIAILNGTAASSSSGAQVIYEANVLLLASQCISVLSMEALQANLEPHHVFPQAGQTEVAGNIVRMARGSKFVLARHPEGDPEFKLKQDRYPIRTVSQAIGPCAENLAQATRQIDIELNSTTDNPLIDTEGESPHNVYHAGNFQALSVADAMDKVRYAMQGLGKLLFAQHTEMLNARFNGGLPPDCAAGEPNVDFGLKSSGLACAAYVSELGFLAGSFLPHVHSSEHHNQSINSMALASARHARTSIELLQQLIATHLYTACQAIDLREMNVRYLDRLQKLLATELQGIISSTGTSVLAEVESELCAAVRARFGETTSLRSEERFDVMLAPLVHELYQKTSSSSDIRLNVSPTLLDWGKSLAMKARELFLANRLAYFTDGGTAVDSLGAGSKVVYGFVRGELGVPMRKGFAGKDPHEIGSDISEIFEALRCGRMDVVWRDAVVATEGRTQRE